jgi:hypothetical protein
MAVDPIPQAQLAPGERLVLRPQIPIVIVLSFAAAVWSALGLAAGLVLGDLRLSLILLAIIALFLYFSLGSYLWADYERVGSSRLFLSGSCPRDQLQAIRTRWVLNRRSRAPRLEFLRGDGKVAFVAPGFLYGYGRLQRFAQQLGVPLLGPRF